MPRTNIAVADSSQAGTTVTYAAADQANGMAFTNTGEEQLRVKNADAAGKTVTIASPGQCNQGFTHDLAGGVEAGTEEVIGPFPPARFNQSDNKVNVDFSAATSVTVAVTKP